MNLKKHYQTLELNKILTMLSEHCISDDAKSDALNITPISDLSEVNSLIKQTEDAYILMARFGSPAFDCIKNIDNPLARAKAGGLLNMGELLLIASILSTASRTIDWHSKCSSIKTSIDFLLNNLYINKFLENKIKTSILSEDEISDNASESLFSIRRKIKAAENKIREKLDSLVRSQTYQRYLQESVVTIRGGRFVVPVKNEHRANVQGLVHDTSSSGATVFIEPMAVVEANNEIKILKAKEEDEIERILYDLSAQTAEFADEILNSYDILRQLDLIFAKAKLAFAMKASVPLVNDKGYINIKKARHPLLDKETVVPVDIQLGENYNTLVITGPNTGGKTVALKTIGLLTLMVMCGLLIPAYDNSCVSVFNLVLADIGDEQSIEQSLSTFSSHMKNIIEIISSADSKTLILLDELCSGTDPVEGAALATSILDYLYSLNATVAATTHYAELKAYALDTKGVINACCEFDVETLAPTYKLLIGVPGRSNAFAISEKLGLEHHIINKAKQLVSKEDNRFERVVLQLETSRKQLEISNNAAMLAKEQAEKSKKEAEITAEKLKEDYNQEIESARQMAKTIVENAKFEVNRLLDDLEKIKKENKSNISKANLAAKEGFKKLEEITIQGETFKEDYSLPRPLKIGDDILLADINKKAYVLTLPDDNQMVTVQAGLIKIKSKLNNIRLLNEKGINIPKSVYKPSHSTQSVSPKKATLEIDLRGQNVEEATMELDRFIDDAILNAINEITVIHGKGTGVLRTGIQKHLRSHASVRTYRLGVFGEGENGVTIVQLK